MTKTKKKKGLVILLSAPSGCGKTTVEKALLSEDRNLKQSISATTRPRRKGERNGKDYFFLTEEEFLIQRKEKAFLEWAKVFDNYYGTPRTSMNALLEKGVDVLLTIDVQGARTVKKKVRDAVSIFLLPPSMAVLKARLYGRKTDSESIIKKRLAIAETELQEAPLYDYVVVNDVLPETVDAVRSIIKAEKYRVERNKEVLHVLRCTGKNDR